MKIRVVLARHIGTRKSFRQLPSFGLFGALLFFLAMGPMCVLKALSYRAAIGLRVHLLEPGVLPMKTVTGANPVIVHLKATHSGGPAKLFLGTKPITWESLDSALKDELIAHGQPVVYLEASQSLNWSDVVRAVDIIRESRVQVILLTPEPNGHAM